MIENIRLAFKGIWSHKMRSFLTMLGIIIGIAAIIAIVSTIQGTSEQIKEDLIGSGNNTVTVTLYENDYTYSADNGSSSIPPIVSQELKEKILALDHVVNATFYYSRTYASNVYYQNNSFSGGNVFGIDANYLNTCGYQVQTGRSFVQDDYTNYNKVALLDNNAAENLFKDVSPIGKTIEIGSEPYVVVGIVTQSDDMLPKVNNIAEFEEYYQSMIGSVLIPDAVWPVSFRFDEPVNAIVKADTTDNMSSVGRAAENIMNESIGGTISESFAYKADDIMERVRSLQKLSESTNQQLIWIASISLLVGGIGVMNIMLVSVTERTKEIGLKKAIGARKRSILGQFLTEASVLTSIGGLIGVLAGIALSRIVSTVTGAPSSISVPAIIISVVFSMLIGVVFGLLPSIKAANLNPIDALRSE